MIELLAGVTHLKNEDSVIVLNNGIGYLIYVTQRDLNELSIEENVIFHTFLNVKEKGLELYGFISQDYKKMFNLLLNVDGVGCKSALKIMNLISPSQLSSYVKNKDIKTLSSIKGISKKMAENLIIKLPSNIDRLFPLSEDDVEVVSNTLNEEDEEIINDCKQGLVALGYTATQSKQCAKKLYIKGMELSELIRLCLSELSSK